MSFTSFLLSKRTIVLIAFSLFIYMYNMSLRPKTSLEFFFLFFLLFILICRLLYMYMYNHDNNKYKYIIATYTPQNKHYRIKKKKVKQKHTQQANKKSCSFEIHRITEPVNKIQEKNNIKMEMKKSAFYYYWEQPKILFCYVLGITSGKQVNHLYETFYGNIVSFYHHCVQSFFLLCYLF